MDQFLVGRLGWSRSRIQRMIHQGLVRCNGKLMKKRGLVHVGDAIEVESEPLSPPCFSEPMDLSVIYEDTDLLVVNKARGIVVHPGAGHACGTLVQGMRAHLEGKGERLVGGEDPEREGIVHRLDRDTTGVLVASKSILAYESLVRQFHDRCVEKEYWALVLGNPGSGVVEGLLGRDPKHRQRMACVSSGGKFARTVYETVACTHEVSFVRIWPKTGRMHQIRVHMAQLGCPVLGDPVYGCAKWNHRLGLSGQCLHAFSLKILHPKRESLLQLRAPVPQEFPSLVRDFHLFLGEEISDHLS